MSKKITILTVFKNLINDLQFICGIPIAGEKKLLIYNIILLRTVQVYIIVSDILAL